MSPDVVPGYKLPKPTLAEKDMLKNDPENRRLYLLEWLKQSASSTTVCCDQISHRRCLSCPQPWDGDEEITFNRAL